MTPRVDAFAVPADINRQQLQDEIGNHEGWRIPMYGESRDTVTGILDVRAFLQQTGNQHLRDAVQPPVFVPETMMALTAFRDYLHEPHSMVIVLDEYGGTEGVLTHEDVIHEIIGDATSSEEEEEPEFRFLSYDRMWAAGTARLDELGEALGVELEREGLDTIGGLVFHELGHLPKEEEEITIGQIRAVVLKTGSKRIEELVVERLAGVQKEEAA
ncbi:MAG: transporter associated domain-containing protein, partial [Verrucomicrobiota bacterium]